MIKKNLIREPSAGVKVFLGGTCKGTDWRETVKEQLRCNYFDPHIKDGEWTDEHYKEEMDERKLICTHTLYVITPASSGFYAIAELIEDSIQRPDNTLVCFLNEGEVKWDETQLSSIDKVLKMVKQYHNNIYSDLDEVISAINVLA